MHNLYSLIIGCFGLGMRIASLFNKKASRWRRGRNNTWDSLEKALSSPFICRKGRKLAWFHCASLGEFEQGRPIIEAFKTQYPEFLILLTFYSSSGYEARKAYPGADLVLYLPLDTRQNAHRFVDTVKPDIVVYVKYEFWFNFLSYLQSQKIPTMLVSAVFRSDQHFFRWYGKWQSKVLKGFTKIFVQNESSRILLQSIGIQNVSVSGDTRFDRVAAVASNPRRIEIAEVFSEDYPVVVAGSTWPADEELIINLIRQNRHGLRFIIAPHEISPRHINQLIEKAGDGALLFSRATPFKAKEATVLIIDSIGLLSQLYQYGTLAYVGGGFGLGIHNILEAAAFGLPVFFGPNFHKFNEAKELIGLGGAFAVHTPDELLLKTELLLADRKKLAVSSSINQKYIQQGKGATEMVMKAVCELIGSRS